jgi:hypothetical protein
MPISYSSVLIKMQIVCKLFIKSIDHNVTFHSFFKVQLLHFKKFESEKYNKEYTNIEGK